uniref:Phytanoyl-CoA dioxygenase n=1 Tax=viral metagenome TaxID=1070528 RepID=A0A6C0DB78_9ZZZZ
MDEKYICTKDTVNETIGKYGVAIIPNILNDAECDNMIKEMWNYLEHISEDFLIPINRHDMNSWESIYNLNGGSLLFEFWNIGHSQMLWDQRQNPKIVEVFAKIWNVKPEELLASFDGASIEIPPEITNYGWYEDNIPFYHTDQSYATPEFKYVQSWVTANDVNPGDATLAFFESSNKYHSEFSELFNVKDPKDWYLLSKKELEFYSSRCIEKKISCPRGSLVLWDGRTIHCGIQSSINRWKPNIRCINYLCYLPRSQSNEENILLKQQALLDLQTTTHNPCIIRFKSRTPYLEIQDESQFIKKINPPYLTDLGKKLAGF